MCHCSLFLAFSLSLFMQSITTVTLDQDYNVSLSSRFSLLALPGALYVKVVWHISSEAAIHFYQFLSLLPATGNKLSRITSSKNAAFLALDQGDDQRCTQEKK